ncbi:MAG: hypothetical protein U0105_15180 [Candidatus Obscuribacterales bacterium]
MKQNIVIALLAGIILGQNMSRATADEAPAGGITKQDLLYAAAICGLCANSRFDPTGHMGLTSNLKGPEGLKKLARNYATVE